LPKIAVIKKENMESIADGYYYYIPEVQALVELTGQRSDTLYGVTTQNQYSAGQALHVPWGADNLAPQNMLRLAAENPIKMQLVKTCRNLLLGNRLMLQTRVLNTDAKTGRKVYEYEPIDDAQIEDYLEMLDVNTYLRKAAYNLEFSGNVFTNVSIDRRRLVTGMDSLDATEVRCQVANPKTGRIDAYHINPNWEFEDMKNTAVVAAFSKANPASFAESILHGRDWTPGQFYYDHPAWWGTKSWTGVANKIAIFHEKGLDSGYAIKYHIKVPKKYFDREGDEVKAKLAQEKFKKDLTAFLNDPNSREKTFISTFNTDQETGKVMPGIEIVAINNQMSDDAYTKLFESANMAQAAGHGLPPQVAGISFGGKFGASGSELRSALQVHLAIHASVGRDILLQPLYAIKKIMAWDRNIFFGFEDKIVTTLDESKTGTQTAPPEPLQNAA
jgi:hypothetical protein